MQLKSISYLIILLLFIVSLSNTSHATIVDLKANTTYTSTTNSSGCPTGANQFSCVSDIVQDVKTSANCITNGGEAGTYGFNGTARNGILPRSKINWVMVKISARDVAAAGANTVFTTINIGGALYNGTSVNPSGVSWGIINSSNHSTNPKTGVVWTTDDLDVIQAGFMSTDCNPDLNVTVINVTVDFTPPANLTANGTIGKPAINLGQNTTFYGNCGASVGNASAVNIWLQNSTNNIAFTNTTTTNTEPVYTNVTSYFLNSLNNANSTYHRFNISATAGGTYYFRVQCNSTTALPFPAANSTSSALTVNTYGYLNVSLVIPDAGALRNITQNATFLVNVSVGCVGVSGAMCGVVNGTVRRNSTAGGQPDTRILNKTSTPFFTISGENQTCGVLNSGNNCSLEWNVTANGTIGTLWVLDVNFTSNNTNVISNDTANFNVNISAVPVATDISFTLSIPAGNGTIFNVTQTTTTIIFNTTDVNGKKTNATNCIGCTPVQTASVAIFRYNNTGNVAINITLNFTTALLSGIVVKAGWADGAYESPTCTAQNLSGTTTCANVTGTTILTRIANLSACCGGGEARDVWVWADYSSLTAGTDEFRNLSSVSAEG